MMPDNQTAIKALNSTVINIQSFGKNKWTNQVWIGNSNDNKSAKNTSYGTETLLRQNNSIKWKDLEICVNRKKTE